MLNNLIEKKTISELKHMRFTRLVWDKKRKKLLENISVNGFDNENHYITITKDNYVLDGNHRLEILRNVFEPDYETNVKIINLKINQILFIIGFLSILFFPIVLFSYLRLQYQISKNKLKNEFKKNS